MHLPRGLQLLVHALCRRDVVFIAGSLVARFLADGARPYLFGILIHCVGIKSRSESAAGSHGSGAITIWSGCRASHAPHQLSEELAMM